jgi:hypothetical protein
MLKLKILILYYKKNHLKILKENTFTYNKWIQKIASKIKMKSNKFNKKSKKLKIKDLNKIQMTLNLIY